MRDVQVENLCAKYWILIALLAIIAKRALPLDSRRVSSNVWTFSPNNFIKQSESYGVIFCLIRNAVADWIFGAATPGLLVTGGKDGRTLKMTWSLALRLAEDWRKVFECCPFVCVCFFLTLSVLDNWIWPKKSWILRCLSTKSTTS